MIISKGDAHIHDYKGVELFRIVEVQRNYQGTAGDKALLYHRCDCGKGLAFEYGSYKAMLELSQRLSKAVSDDESSENALDRMENR